MFRFQMVSMLRFIQPERRLLGWTRRSMKNRPLEVRWKRAWGKRNEWSLRNGNEYFPKLCGASGG